MDRVESSSGHRDSPRATPEETLVQAGRSEGDGRHHEWMGISGRPGPNGKRSKDQAYRSRGEEIQSAGTAVESPPPLPGSWVFLGLAVKSAGAIVRTRAGAAGTFCSGYEGLESR